MPLTRPAVSKPRKIRRQTAAKFYVRSDRSAISCSEHRSPLRRARSGARSPETLHLCRRHPEWQRDLRQWHTVDLVHEQDFPLARSKPGDKLVLVRDLFPRAINRAAIADLHRPSSRARSPVSAMRGERSAAAGGPDNATRSARNPGAGRVRFRTAPAVRSGLSARARGC
jgi:hypothetical protein